MTKKLLIKTTIGIEIMNLMDAAYEDEAIFKFKQREKSDLWGDYISHRDLKEGELPDDNYFRAAWFDNNGTINIDLNKAKKIHLEKIRELRDSRWEDFNERYLIAQMDDGNLSELKKERQALKDAPQLVSEKIKNMKSLSNIKNTIPNILKK